MLIKKIIPIPSTNEPVDRIPIIQYLAAFSGTLLFFAMGTTFGWTGPVLIQLAEEDAPIHADDDQQSWIVAMAPIGSTIGPFFGAFVVDVIGRKNTLLLGAIPYLITWILIYFATNVYMYYLARFFSGASAGIALNVIPMYLGEISSPSIRGILANTSMVQANLGLLVMYTIGAYFSIKTNAIICAFVPFIFLLTFIWMPESPYFYLSKGEQSKAIEALKRLRGNRCDIHAEIRTISDALQEQKTSNRSFYDLLSIPSNRKALIISLGLFTTVQLSGFTVITAYAPTIFKSLQADLSPSISGILFAGISVITAFISGFLVDSLGRKVLLATFTFGMSVPLFIIALFFHLANTTELDISNYSMIPTVALILYPFTYGIGGSIPVVCMGELFPTNVKALASLIVVTFSSAVLFVNTQIYKTLGLTMGLQYIFGLYMCTCVLSGILILLYMPETKCRTLEDIQKDLKSTKT